MIIYIEGFYDKVAPIKVGATQTPSLVRILWTPLVTGLIQAASLVSRVVKPGDAEIVVKKVSRKGDTMIRTGLDGLKNFLFGIHLRYRLGI